MSSLKKTGPVKAKATDKSVDSQRENEIAGDNNIAELDFSTDAPEPSFQNLTPETEAAEEYTTATSAGSLTEGEASEDDLAPEILIKEDGAASPREAGGDQPADQLLRVVDADKIGAGTGLDEAELAELDPLNKAAAKKVTAKN